MCVHTYLYIYTHVDIIIQSIYIYTYTYIYMYMFTLYTPSISCGRFSKTLRRLPYFSNNQGFRV